MDSVKCTRCGHDIPSDNLDVHELRCAATREGKIPDAPAVSAVAEALAPPRASVSCHLCGAGVLPSEYDAHVETCMSSNGQCPICMGTFPITTLEEHASRCTGEGSAPSLPTRASGRTASGAPPSATPGAAATGDSPTGSRGKCAVAGCEFFATPGLKGLCSGCSRGDGRPLGGFSASAKGKASVVKTSLSVGRRTIEVRLGDITLEEVDAIVNAANGRLDNASGVAGAISAAGGPSIQRECDEYFHEKGRVLEGCCMVTKPGNLKCRHVIHAVGPVWKDGQSEEEKLLRSCVLKSLKEASHMNLFSISFPAISSGIFGFPKPKCANIMVNAALHFFRENPETSILFVRFTNFDEETTQCFVSACAMTRKLPANEALLERKLKKGSIRVHRGKVCYERCEYAAVPVNIDGEIFDQVISTHSEIRGELLESLIKENDGSHRITKSLLVFPRHQLYIDGIVLFRCPLWNGKGIEDATAFLDELVLMFTVMAEHKSKRSPPAEPGAPPPRASVALPLLGSKRFGFPPHVAARLILHAATTAIDSGLVESVVLVDEEDASAFDLCVKANINFDGELAAFDLDSYVNSVTTQTEKKPVPKNETPTQRRERLRAEAAARLQQQLLSEQQRLVETAAQGGTDGAHVD